MPDSESPNPSETLLTAAGDWLKAILPRLNPQELEVVYACFDGAADLRIEIRFVEGALVLQAANEAAGEVLELYREEFEPLRRTSLQ
jgi:hypothetical protein